jgi:hypothetical protein
MKGKLIKTKSVFCRMRFFWIHRFVTAPNLRFSTNFFFLSRATDDVLRDTVGVEINSLSSRFGNNMICYQLLAKFFKGPKTRKELKKHL